MDYDELTEQVREVENRVREHRLPVKDISVETDALVAGNVKLRLAPVGLSRVCKRLGAPYEYLSKLDERVRASLLQHHFDRGDLGNVASILSLRDEFLAFGQPDLLRLSGTDVLDAVAQGIGQDTATVTIHGTHFSDDSFQFDLLNSQGEEVAPGDVLQAGLRITHSFIGEHATWIEVFILRLVCSNGLTHRDCVSRRAARTRRLPAHHPNALELQRAQIRRLAEAAWISLDQKLHAIRGLQEERIEVERLLRRWIERARLSVRTLMPLLQQAWETEGAQETTYGAINALTRVATHHPDLQPRQRRVLSGLAGLLAFRHQHLCPRCFSVLRGPSINADDPSFTQNAGIDEAMV